MDRFQHTAIKLFREITLADTQEQEDNWRAWLRIAGNLNNPSVLAQEISKLNIDHNVGDIAASFRDPNLIQQLSPYVQWSDLEVDTQTYEEGYKKRFLVKHAHRPWFGVPYSEHSWWVQKLSCVSAPSEEEQYDAVVLLEHLIQQNTITAQTKLCLNVFDNHPKCTFRHAAMAFGVPPVKGLIVSESTSDIEDMTLGALSAVMSGFFQSNQTSQAPTHEYVSHYRNTLEALDPTQQCTVLPSTWAKRWNIHQGSNALVFAAIVGCLDEEGRRALLDTNKDFLKRYVDQASSEECAHLVTTLYDIWIKEQASFSFFANQQISIIIEKCTPEQKAQIVTHLCEQISAHVNTDTLNRSYRQLLLALSTEKSFINCLSNPSDITKMLSTLTTAFPLTKENKKRNQAPDITVVNHACIQEFWSNKKELPSKYVHWCADPWKDMVKRHIDGLQSDLSSLENSLKSYSVSQAEKERLVLALSVFNMNDWTADAQYFAECENMHIANNIEGASRAPNKTKKM